MSSTSIVGRHQRVLRMLDRIRAGEPLNADDLARQWSISKRTVFRDLDLLRDAGVLVHFDERAACYRVMSPDDVTEAPSFEAEELTVLVAAVRFSMLQRLPAYREGLRRATSKLLSRAPFRVCQSVSRLTRACVVGDADDPNPIETGQVIKQILQAIRQRRTLQVAIASPHGEVLQTRLSPYQMIATPNAWEVVGRSTHHRAVRVFNPRDFARAEMTDHAFAIPRGYYRDSAILSDANKVN